MEERLRSALAERSAAGLYRQRRIVESPQGTLVRHGGRELLTFCSNDYLGLANHPAVVQALRAGAERWGAGAGAAHLVSGHMAPHHALEEELADFVGRPRALLFSTGYMANLGTVAALLRRGDRVYQDRLNHASLLDAARLAAARLVRYRHADSADLAARLTAGPGLVVTDGVFSMDGDLAPLPELAAASRTGGSWLMVDDAHGLGVLGPGGGGTLEHFGLGSHQVPVLVGTLGKAFGTFGAFVAGDDLLAETLIQFARPYIYTTAIPPAVAEATRTALRLVRSEGWRREALAARVRQFRAGAAQLGFELMDSPTPIQPIVLHDAERASRLSAALEQAGILATAIRPPTVPEGTARLRITFTAEHTESQVERLLDALDQAVAAAGREPAG